ncbi:hypothetical protein RRG08_025936 [Elysia crispata]|uniref:Uncharacterized protein n=1 Tax=Elysia crispata TaxID=231223 RepID=A0AAE1DFI4_9GAST|nr:hypothetical protein RRG08_025936 [Elysia crispata]
MAGVEIKMNEFGKTEDDVYNKDDIEDDIFDDEDFVYDDGIDDGAQGDITRLFPSTIPGKLEKISMTKG